MKRIILSICIFFSFSILVEAQLPETIVVKTKRIKGYGPFHDALAKGGSPLSTMGSGSPWFKAIPKINGIPEKLDRLMFCTIEEDLLQHVYQNYYSNKIDEKFYNALKNNLGWEPDSLSYSKKFVKVSIGIAAGYDINNNLLVAIDRNNNYDLMDDGYYVVPKETPGQAYEERYSDLLPIGVEYQYFDGNNILKDSVWIYIDYLPKNNSDEDGPVKLAYNIAEHRYGEFKINDKIYSLALYKWKAISRGQYKVKVWQNGSDIDFSDVKEIRKGEAVNLEGENYIVMNSSLTGEFVTLVKESSVSNKRGDYTGSIAYDFQATTLSGKEFRLDKMRGNYVVLDFWGSWCAPCRREVPKLKEIYEKYSKNNFVMIGIANDKLKDLKKYTDKEKIKWIQVLQDEDKKIIALYNILSYPTTFLIDTEGKIIGKNIRAKELENKLGEIFKN